MDKINIKEMKDRLKILSIILTSIVIITFIITPFKNNQNIQKTDLSICLDENGKKIFETQFEKQKNYINIIIILFLLIPKNLI